MNYANFAFEEDMQSFQFQFQLFCTHDKKCYICRRKSNNPIKIEI